MERGFEIRRITRRILARDFTAGPLEADFKSALHFG
jgi:hypothetical protein